jgi:predicted negative regulator of RcsB-dependent stress response
MTKTDVASKPNSSEIADPFEEKLRLAWARYGKLFFILCGLVAAGILVKGGLDYLAAQKELNIQKDYAAATTPDSLKAFAAAHRGDPLAGLAELRVADTAYGAGSFADAAANYSFAVADLPAGPFKGRARLGFAMSQAQSGKASEAETGLREVLNNEAELKPIRCEAAYHLAGLAVAAGRPGEVQKLAEQLMQIDPSSPFAERMMTLRASVPDAAPAASLVPSVAIPAVH